MILKDAADCRNGGLTKLAIELTLLPGVGLITQNRIRKKLPRLEALFSLGEDGLQAVGVPREARTPIRRRAFRSEAEKIYNWAVNAGVHIILAGSTGYPELLGEIPDPPTVFYARGNLDALAAPSVAIVGTRRPTVYGLRMAEEFGADLGERGLCVVSGLARGVDAAAHRGCLEKDGTTIAVLGCGIDIIYPREHRQLAERITQKGLIISEFPPGTSPSPRNFPIRNRIVSGLSLGTLVIEAGERSGSLITARLAMEQNREVFALPGNVTSPQSLGPNFLIKQGAKLVQGWRDIVDELPEEIRRNIFLKEEAQISEKPATGAVSEDGARLLELLKDDEAVHFDGLAEQFGLNIPRLSFALMELEAAGLARQLPGSMYVKLRGDL
ncbi:MAG: DNA-processing protein DprA [Acidobacteriota bacterium]|jgi:DNA processing protein|nr:DNA-processing protein DprA [Acidobacteriota bacterium]